jgi:hypothetical protein
VENRGSLDKDPLITRSNKIPPASPRNRLLCEYFSQVMMAAGDLSRKRYSWPMIRVGGSLFCVYPTAGAMPLHLASDHIHQYRRAGAVA